MRLPNGYGTVYKLSGKRRKPYIARKTISWSKEGKQIYSTLGYYKTKTEALQALAEYNNDPYDLLISKITFSEIYEKWFNDTFNNNSNKSTVKNYKTAYNRCEAIYDSKIVDLRLPDLQMLVDDCPSDYQSVGRIKSLLCKIYEWCIRKEYLKKNYAELILLPQIEKTSKERRTMTKEHIQKIWDLSSSNDIAKIALILIYSGVRINELLNLKKEDVNIEEQWFKVRASKTNAGIRIVPIADKVLDFWKLYLNKSKCNYAICTAEGQQLTYENFRKRHWVNLMNTLEFDYVIHETRHTCNSLLIMSNCNPTIRKKIIGHKSQMDIGEAVYGHIYNEELLKAINKIWNNGDWRIIQSP